MLIVAILEITETFRFERHAIYTLYRVGMNCNYISPTTSNMRLRYQSF